MAESFEKRQRERRKEQKKRAKEDGDNPYPSWDQLKAEDREEAPSIELTVRDAAHHIAGPAGKGFHRVAWDMRYPAPHPVNLNPPSNLPPWQDPNGRDAVACLRAAAYAAIQAEARVARGTSSTASASSATQTALETTKNRGSETR